MYPINTLKENNQIINNVISVPLKIIMRSFLITYNNTSSQSYSAYINLNLDDLIPKKIVLNNILVLDTVAISIDFNSPNNTFTIGMPGLLDFDIYVPATFFAFFFLSTPGNLEFSNYRTLNNLLQVILSSNVNMNTPIVLLFNMMFYY